MCALLKVNMFGIAVKESQVPILGYNERDGAFFSLAQSKCGLMAHAQRADFVVAEKLFRFMVRVGEPGLSDVFIAYLDFSAETHDVERSMHVNASVCFTQSCGRLRMREQFPETRIPHSGEVSHLGCIRCFCDICQATLILTPSACTEPHSQHALMLSVFGALSWLFFGFHLRLALGRIGIGIRQPRSDQTALPLLT